MKTIHFKLFVNRRGRGPSRLWLTKAGWSPHQFNARHLDHREAMELRDYFKASGADVGLLEERHANA